MTPFEKSLVEHISLVKIDVVNEEFTPLKSLFKIETVPSLVLFHEGIMDEKYRFGV